MKFIYYDTETTGLKIGEDRIIEIAAYNPVTGATFESFVHPGVPIPPDATKIHNITDEMIKDAPAFDAVFQAFSRFCGTEVILIAHNNDSFDKPMLIAELTRFGLAPPQEWQWLDSLKWARKYRSDLPRHTLQHLRETFGIKANTAHRALGDVFTLHKVFSLLIDDLAPTTVLTLLGEEEILRTMPFGKYKGTLLKDIPRDYIAWLQQNGAFERSDNQMLKKSFQELGVLF